MISTKNVIKAVFANKPKVNFVAYEIFNSVFVFHFSLSTILCMRTGIPNLLNKIKIAEIK